MEESHHLPSYESAISKDPLPLIAPYLGPQTLLSCLLVCWRWSKIFKTAIDQHPHVFFETRHRSRLAGFLKWLAVGNKFGLKKLNLEDLQADVYSVIPEDWLLRILETNCMDLNLCHTSFLDDKSLRRATIRKHNSTLTCLFLASPAVSYVLLGKLLSMLQLEHLALRDAVINEQLLLKLPYTLRTIDLMHSRITNKHVRIIAERMKTNLLSLNLENTSISDAAIISLLDYCFLPPGYDTSHSTHGMRHLLIAGTRVSEKMTSRLISTSVLHGISCDYQIDFSHSPHLVFLSLPSSQQMVIPSTVEKLVLFQVGSGEWPCILQKVSRTNVRSLTVRIKEINEDFGDFSEISSSDIAEEILQYRPRFRGRLQIEWKISDGEWGLQQY